MNPTEEDRVEAKEYESVYDQEKVNRTEDEDNEEDDEEEEEQDFEEEQYDGQETCCRKATSLSPMVEHIPSMESVAPHEWASYNKKICEHHM